MTISTKGRYALRMLVDLAEHQDRGYIALRDIAVRQGISKKYLEQIIPLLNQSDILLATRGFQGGATVYLGGRRNIQWGRFCALRRESWPRWPA